MPGLNLVNVAVELGPLITPEMMARFPATFPEPTLALLVKNHGPLKVRPAGLPTMLIPLVELFLSQVTVLVMVTAADPASASPQFTPAVLLTIMEPVPKALP